LAQICNPLDLALDETHSRKTLYILDSSLVRAVNLNANPPTISTFAGGGTAPSPGYGDGSPATSAALNSPNHIAVAPAGDFLYIADTGIARFRRVDISSGLISAWLSTPPNTTCTQTSCNGFIYNDCAIGFDNSQNAYVSYPAGGAASQCYGGAPGAIYRVGSNGSTTLVAGGGTTVGEGVAAAGAALAQSISKILFDVAGNLYVVERAANRIRRVEAGVGRVTTIAGTGTAGYAGDYSDARQAQFNNPWTALFGANQDLIVSDTSNSAVRTIWSFGAATAAFAMLNITSANPQSVVVDQVTAQLSVQLLDPAAQPLSGFTINWGILDPGGAVYVNSAVTNLSGVATSFARAGLLSGAAYRFSASVNVFGGPLPTSPATLTVNTIAPAAGSMFTTVDVDHLAGGDGYPGAATRAHINNPTGLATAKDGTLYIAGSSNNQVFALSPAGFLSVVAGTGTCGHAGDGGFATAAQICAPLDLTLDETPPRKTLYITDGVLIRAVDLTAATPTISTFAGGGTAPGPGYGDGNPATFATLVSPNHIAVGPAGDFLYIADTGAVDSTTTGRFRRVDLSSGIINKWLSPPANTTCVATACQNFVYNDCTIGFDNSQNPYVSYAAGNSASACSGGSPGGVYKVASNLSTTLVAGGGTNLGEGIPAVGAALSPNITRLLFDPGGTLYIVERLGSQFAGAPPSHRVRKLSDLTPSATIKTVIGTGTAGNGADGPNLLAIALSSPWGLAVLPDKKMVVSDSGNSTVRAIWPPYP
jgi:sugar lactone lactonase YvrE